MKKTALLLLVALPTIMCAQSWSLHRCIDYALEHNITIRQQQNTAVLQQIQLDDNRGNHLPNMDASVSQNFSFGRGLTAQNTYENNNTSNSSLSLSASVPLFAGYKIVNSVKMARLNLDASLADLEKARDDIRSQVAKAYVQILYDKEIAAVAQRQIEIDSLQVVRLQQMFDAGRASAVEVAQQQAQLAKSRLTATTANNSLALSVLALTQLLELPSPDGFFIVVPDTSSVSIMQEPLPLPDIVYAEAIGIKPQIRAEQLRLAVSDYNIRIARGDYLPTLSLSGGIGTNYYKTSGFRADPFGTQLKNNFSQYLGINLSVPVFNHFSTRNKIRQAKIERSNSQLRLDAEKKALYKEIQQVYYNALAAKSKWESSNEAVVSAQAAFGLAKAKYENGKATITEFNEQKNSMLSAMSDLVQAKYEYLYQSALLDFYQGKELDF